MSRIKYLLEQIERARRFAASMTNADDRGRLEAAADKYQHELDALSSPKSIEPAANAEMEATTPETAAQPDAGEGNAGAADDGAPTTSSDTSQPEAD